MVKKLIGAILLIAGSCIGAGMLGFPLVTGSSGFVPSIAILLVAWAFMTMTAFLLLEINIWLGPQVSIVTMASSTLGKVGKALAWILFCYLFYLVLVAYAAASGSLASDFFRQFFNMNFPPWVGSLAFTLFFGFVIWLGTAAVDQTNRWLMFGLGFAYVLLVALGSRDVQETYLHHARWSSIYAALPVVIFGFGFHNMIPSITRYLEGHARRLRWAVAIGSLIPLAIYLLYEWVILGLVAAEQFIEGLPKGELASHAVAARPGGHIVAAAASAFAFFALVTSFIAQALSLVHFLADGLNWSSKRRHTTPLVFLALAPPFLAAWWDPTIFIQALELAAAFGAVTLFGILPALMVWVKRYGHGNREFRSIPGGRPMLVGVILFSLLVMAIKIQGMVAG